MLLISLFICRVLFSFVTCPTIKVNSFELNIDIDIYNFFCYFVGSIEGFADGTTAVSQTTEDGNISALSLKVFSSSLSDNVKRLCFNLYRCSRPTLANISRQFFFTFHLSTSFFFSSVYKFSRLFRESQIISSPRATPMKAWLPFSDRFTKSRRILFLTKIFQASFFEQFLNYLVGVYPFLYSAHFCLSLSFSLSLSLFF